MHSGCKDNSDLPRDSNLVFMEEDREKIATCAYFTRSVLTIWLTCFAGDGGIGIKRTKMRRVRCRADAAVYGFP